MENTISVEAVINAPIDKVWDFWTDPKHITKWCFASDDWHAPSSSSELKVGGKITTRMEAKDGSFGFDFWGIYNEIKPNEKIQITMGDNRKWETHFVKVDGGVKVTELFEAEDQNPIEMQKMGWQAILNNFKKYVESN